MVDRQYSVRRSSLDLDNALQNADKAQSNQQKKKTTRRTAAASTTTAGVLTAQRSEKENQGSPSSMAGSNGTRNKTGATISVNKSDYEKLKTDKDNASKMAAKYKKKLEEATKQVATLTSSLESAEGSEDAIQNLEEQVRVLEREKKKMQQWIDEAKTNMDNQMNDIKELEEKLAKAGDDTLNQKKDMVDHVTVTTKTLLWREIKFVEDDADLDEVTREVFPLLTIDPEMDVDMFVKTYRNVVNKSIGDMRTYVQGECKKRAKEFFDDHQKLPTPDDMLKVWDLCNLKLGDEEHAYMKDFVIWYYDRWLPVISGREYWDKQIRHYKIPTERVEISGKKQPLISVAMEGFGVLMMDNCYDKWLAEYEWKKDDPKRKLPTKGDDYEQFKGKYSDSKCGQITFGGWDPAGFEVFVGYQEKIKATRKADAANGKTQQKYALELVRAFHGIEQAQPRKSNRSRKSTEKAAPVAKRLKRVVESDDEDDE